MRLLLITAILLSSTLIISAQIESQLVQINIRYQSTLAAIPELYEIRLGERKVDYINPITEIPAGKLEITTKKFSQKNWQSIRALINSLKLESLESSSSQGIDGAWYSLIIKYSDQKTKDVKVWGGYAPAELLKLHNLIKLDR